MNNTIAYLHPRHAGHDTSRMYIHLNRLTTFHNSCYASIKAPHLSHQIFESSSRSHLDEKRLLNQSAAATPLTTPPIQPLRSLNLPLISRPEMDEQRPLRSQRHHTPLHSPPPAGRRSYPKPHDGHGGTTIHSTVAGSEKTDILTASKMVCTESSASLLRHHPSHGGALSLAASFATFYRAASLSASWRHISKSTPCGTRSAFQRQRRRQSRIHARSIDRSIDQQRTAVSAFGHSFTPHLICLLFLFSKNKDRHRGRPAGAASQTDRQMAMDRWMDGCMELFRHWRARLGAPDILSVWSGMSS